MAALCQAAPLRHVATTQLPTESVYDLRSQLLLAEHGHGTGDSSGDADAQQQKGDEPREDRSDDGYDELEERSETAKPKRLRELGNTAVQAKFDLFQHSILECLTTLAQLPEFRPQLQKVRIRFPRN